jgi:serine/threonine protein phosphatase PrpC
MQLTPMPPALTFSERLYRLLLCLYPARFRHTYCREMTLLFRDCYREARQQPGARGMIRFWGFILYELTITACVEHYRTVLATFRHLMGVEEKEFLMANALFSLEVAARTDKGIKRQLNEDNMTSVVPEDTQVLAQKGALFVVADGLGGHDKGEIASELVVRVVSESYYQDPSTDIGPSLVRAMRQANIALSHSIEQVGRTADSMGTTCIAAILHDSTAYVANVGDSRAYIVRKGQARQISLDHSWVAEQVRLGNLTKEEARNHEKSNQIYRCMGEHTDVEIDLFTEPVQDGDILVLCTDGLTNVVTDEEIATIVTQYNSQESTARLIARANENGGPDNITAIVVHVSLPSDKS